MIIKKTERIREMACSTSVNLILRPHKQKQFNRHEIKGRDDYSKKSGNGPNKYRHFTSIGKERAGRWLVIFSQHYGVEGKPFIPSLWGNSEGDLFFFLGASPTTQSTLQQLSTLPQKVTMTNPHCVLGHWGEGRKVLHRVYECSFEL